MVRGKPEIHQRGSRGKPEQFGGDEVQLDFCGARCNARDYRALMMSEQHRIGAGQCFGYMLDHEFTHQSFRPHRGEACGAGFGSGRHSVAPLIDDAIAIESRRLACGARSCRLLDGAVAEASCFLQLVDRTLQHLGGEGEARDADALEGERRARDLPRLSFGAEQRAIRHLDIVEEHFVNVAFTDDARNLPHDDAARIHRQQKNGNAALPGGSSRQHEAGIGMTCVGCPNFLAVDPIARALLLGACAQRSEIGARLRLREALAPDRLAARHRRNVARLLFCGAEAHQRRANPVHIHVLAAARLARLPHLFGQNK